MFFQSIIIYFFYLFSKAGHRTVLRNVQSSQRLVMDQATIFLSCSFQKESIARSIDQRTSVSLDLESFETIILGVMGISSEFSSLL